VVSINIPVNWKQMAAGQDIIFAPTGASGPRGFTHGILLGSTPTSGANLAAAAKTFINTTLKNNSYLRQLGVLSQGSLGKQRAVTGYLIGLSPITGKPEQISVNATIFKNDTLLYVVTVSPKSESTAYNSVFNAILRSVQIDGQPTKLKPAKQAQAPSSLKWRMF
jgi:hypothetical protein